jgi:translocator protein
MEVATEMAQDRNGLKALGETFGAILLCNGIGGLSALASIRDDEWYDSLEKPSFQPPKWLFGPAWTVLYSLMGVTLSILWRARGKDEDADPAIALFSVQLFLNSFWSLLFFRWKKPGWSLVEIVVLLCAIVMTIRASWKVSPIAGALMVPYLAWVGFATALNFSLWKLNR